MYSNTAQEILRSVNTNEDIVSSEQNKSARSETLEKRSDEAAARGVLYTMRSGPCTGERLGSKWSTRPGRKHLARGRTARGSSAPPATASAAGPSCTESVNVDAIWIFALRSEETSRLKSYRCARKCIRRIQYLRNSR